MKHRWLVCWFKQCLDQGVPEFRNVGGLKHHLETQHDRTFCDVCLKGRLVFIAEQKLYHRWRVEQHKEHGDPGGEAGVIILPHPWCNFCNMYLFNDTQLAEHLHQNHLKCHICPDPHLYYRDYRSLEKHFDLTHYMCQDANCKAACYVVFQSPEELTMHNIQVHRKDAEKGAMA